MNKIFIFSAGPGGRDVLQLIKDINKEKKVWEVLGFVDTDLDLKDKSIDGIKVYLPEDLQKQNKDNFFGICGVLDPTIRELIVQNEIIPLGYKIPSLIHPTAVIADDFVPEEGLIIFSGVNISYNVSINKYVLVSFSCLVGHDSKIGEYSSLLPASLMDGRCIVGKKTILGSGAILHPEVKVGSKATIGMGTVVLNDVEEGITLTQMPRMIKLNNK